MRGPPDMGEERTQLRWESRYNLESLQSINIYFLLVRSVGRKLQGAAVANHTPLFWPHLP